MKSLRIKNFAALTLAGIIYAIGVTIFIAPVDLYDSGISGTSMLLGQITPSFLHLSFFLIALNVPLFLYGLRRQGLAGRTVTLKVKFEDFRQVTRQVTLPRRICGTEAIYKTARGILDALELPRRVRLIGVGVSGFEEGPPE